MLRMFSTMWIFIFYVMNNVYAGDKINITTSTCGRKYDMDFYKTIDATHSGNSLLNENPCSLEFTKTSSDKILCISFQNTKLDCYTSLEIHKGHLTTNTPEVKMLCNGIIDTKWCSSRYQDNVYIVVRKSSRNTSDDVTLRVYLKDFSVSDDDNSTELILILVISVSVFFVMCGFVCGVCGRQKGKPSEDNAQNVNQDSPGDTNLQAGQASTSPFPATGFTQPNPQMYPPVQQGGLQGNHNVHPMQSAYPAQQATAPVSQTMFSQSENQLQSYNNAPSIDTSAPPPSYESVVGEKF